MGKLIKGALSLVGLGGAAPTVSNAAPKAIAADQAAQGANKAALVATAGGINGEQLTPDQIKRRDNLFGN